MGQQGASELESLTVAGPESSVRPSPACRVCGAAGCSTRNHTHMERIRAGVGEHRATIRALGLTEGEKDQRERDQRDEAANTYDRPMLRSECRSMPRPCPFVSCRSHLYLEVGDNGSIHLNFPHLEVWEMPETCAEDLAERGPRNCEDTGKALGLTKQRIRQVEIVALVKIKRRNGGGLLGKVPSTRVKKNG